MTAPHTVGLGELVALTGYGRSTLYYRIQQGYVQAERDERGEYRVPVSEVAKLARRQKYARHPSL